MVDPDPDGVPSAIRTYVECIRRTPPDATHRLVVQDDALPCARFVERATAALSERPHDLVAFFVPGTGLHGRWMREAAKRGQPWVQLPTSANWQPVVALSWPVELVEPFIDFADAHIAKRLARRLRTIGDDPVVGAFCRAQRRAVWATVPSLVEHPDLEPSLVKQRSYGGRNPARRAAVFVGD